MKVPDHTHDSPLDFPEEAGPASRGLGWTTAVVAVAAVVLACLNADAARRWVRDEPPGPVVAALTPPIEGWADTVDAVFGGPAGRLRSAWRLLAGDR